MIETMQPGSTRSTSPIPALMTHSPTPKQRSPFLKNYDRVRGLVIGPRVKLSKDSLIMKAAMAAATKNWAVREQAACIYGRF